MRNRNWTAFAWHRADWKQNPGLLNIHVQAMPLPLLQKHPINPLYCVLNVHGAWLTATGEWQLQPEHVADCWPTPGNPFYERCMFKTLQEAQDAADNAMTEARRRTP